MIPALWALLALFALRVLGQALVAFFDALADLDPAFVILVGLWQRRQLAR